MNKPKLKLVGEDGNVFFIIGRAIKTARRAGWSKEEIDKMRIEATSGDYDKVLQTMVKYFEVE